MGIPECVITLDNQWNTYYPGQTINGTVNYTFDKPKKVRGICIKFKGIAETCWHEKETRRDQTNVQDVNNAGQHTNTNRTVDVAHTANEEYFSISYYLLGNKNGDGIEIPAGIHSYPFTCALPPTLPSSYEGEHGFVRYTIKTTLDRPWKFDQDTKMAFTVVSHMDLNTMPQCKQPIRIEMRERFCCCWCKSGPLTVDVCLPVSGYCSGQAIPVDISVENGSNVEVTDIEIKLVKNIKFYAHSPANSCKEIEVMISKIKTESIPQNTSKNFLKSLEIPPLPPSSLTNCSIIDIDYQLKVLCIVSGLHCDLNETHPITIGTVPFVDYQPPPPTGETIMAIPDIPQNQASVAAPLLSQSYGQPGYPQQYPQANPPFNSQSPPQNYPGYPSNGNYPAQSPYPNASAPQIGDNPNFQYAGAPQFQPVFREGQFSAKSIHDSADNEHTKISGNQEFSPCYPTYGFVIPK